MSTDGARFFRRLVFVEPYSLGFTLVPYEGAISSFDLSYSYSSIPLTSLIIPLKTTK
jgi:hypothetical protein